MLEGTVFDHASNLKRNYSTVCYHASIAVMYEQQRSYQYNHEQLGACR